MRLLGTAAIAAVMLVPFGSLGRVEASTGPYTLPFFDNSVGVTQGFGCTGFPAEPPYGNCAHYHAGIDYSTGWGKVASALGGTVIDVVENIADHTSGCGSGGGNYVLIDHHNGQYTLYYHLKQWSVWPQIGDDVNYGQWLATSGNTGMSCGAHLHYALLNSAAWWVTANALNPGGRWTTDPGRVPWHGSYVNEAYPSGWTTFDGSTVTTWVRFKNTGGRPWKATDPALGRGRIVIAAVTSAGDILRSSVFYVSGDWESSSIPGRADQSTVSPNATATFTWKMRSYSTGSFTERFNLRSDGLFMFDYWESGGISGYYIPITVVHCC